MPKMLDDAYTKFNILREKRGLRTVSRRDFMRLMATASAGLSIPFSKGCSSKDSNAPVPDEISETVGGQTANQTNSSATSQAIVDGGSPIIGSNSADSSSGNIEQAGSSSSSNGDSGGQSGSRENVSGQSSSQGDVSGESAPDTAIDAGVEPIVDSSTVQAFLFDELSEIYDTGKQAAKALGITKNSMTGANIFIKPNVLCFGLTPFDAENGECTKLEIVFGVAEMCLEAGAAKVTIGDGAQGISWDWQEAVFLKGNVINGATNIKAAVDYLKSTYGDDRVELSCLNEVDEWSYIPSCSTDSRVSDGLMIAKSFDEADHVISIAVPKSHVYAMMTGAIKNYFGVVPSVHLGLPGGVGRTKAHAAYYNATCGDVQNVGVTGAYMDVLRWRKDQGKEDFTILDCTISIEADGPNPPPTNNGITIHHKERNKIGKYYLLASQDLVAADSIAAQIMNFPFESVKQFAVARSWGIGAIEDAKLKGATLEDLIISDWIKPNLIDEAIFLMAG